MKKTINLIFAPLPERAGIDYRRVDFSYVGFATIWGFILFDEIPTPLVSLGIILIVIAGTIAARGKSG